MPEAAAKRIHFGADRAEGLNRITGGQKSHPQRTRRLSNAPLHRMQSIASVGQVRGPDIFTGRYQISHPNGNHGSQWEFKGQCFKVDIVVSTCCGMQIKRITAHADRISIGFTQVLDTT